MSNEFINFVDTSKLQQRQAGRKFYRLNGAIYIVNIERFKADRQLYQKGSFAYIMSQERSVDIDTELDFKLAEQIFAYRGGLRTNSHKSVSSFCRLVPEHISKEVCVA